MVQTYMLVLCVPWCHADRKSVYMVYVKVNASSTRPLKVTVSFPLACQGQLPHHCTDVLTNPNLPYPYTTYNPALITTNLTHLHLNVPHQPHTPQAQNRTTHYSTLTQLAECIVGVWCNFVFCTLARYMDSSNELTWPSLLVFLYTCRANHLLSCSYINSVV